MKKRDPIVSALTRAEAHLSQQKKPIPEGEVDTPRDVLGAKSFTREIPADVPIAPSGITSEDTYNDSAQRMADAQGGGPRLDKLAVDPETGAIRTRNEVTDVIEKIEALLKELRLLTEGKS